MLLTGAAEDDLATTVRTEGPWIAIAADVRYRGSPEPAGLAAALTGSGHVPAVIQPEDFDRDYLLGIDLLLARGHSRALLDVLDVAESLHVAVVNRRAAIEAVQDRSRVALTLTAAGVRTPPTRFGTPVAISLASRAADFPMLVKPAFGDARDVRVVRTRDELAALGAGRTFALAQRGLPPEADHLTLYVAGSQVFAARARSPFVGRGRARARPIDVTPALRQLALRCGWLFGLELFEVHCVDAPRGPVVTDVYDFPDPTRVAGGDADAWLARQVLAKARRVARRRERR
jgi:glutathione synthase/RimK-type ligase-like ATP-grasp enzyme